MRIEKLPEGVYLATSNDVQGLIAQGRTIEETLEIARDVAQKLIEAQASTRPADPRSFFRVVDLLELINLVEHRVLPGRMLDVTGLYA